MTNLAICLETLQRNVNDASFLTRGRSFLCLLLNVTFLSKMFCLLFFKGRIWHNNYKGTFARFAIYRTKSNRGRNSQLGHRVWRQWGWNYWLWRILRNDDETIQRFLPNFYRPYFFLLKKSWNYSIVAEKIVKSFIFCWIIRHFFSLPFSPFFFFFARKIVNFLILDVDQTLEIKEAFKIFDRDGNGFIDAKELKQVVTRLGQVLTSDEADEFMLEADLDGDGKLDYNEFVRMMLQEAWSQVHFYYPQEKKLSNCTSQENVRYIFHWQSDCKSK